MRLQTFFVRGKMWIHWVLNLFNLACWLQNYKIGFQPFWISFSDLSLCKPYNQECLFSVQTVWLLYIIIATVYRKKFLYAYYMYPRIFIFYKISSASLNNWTFLLFKYQPFIVFSFDILRNPEQRKLEICCTAFFENFRNSFAWLTFNFESFSLASEL